MNRRRTRVIAGLTFAVLLAAEPSPMGHADPGSEPAKPAEEIVVTQVDHTASDVDWGRAVGVVNAPAQKVLSVVEDYGGYQRFLPHFHASRVLSQRGSAALVYLEAGIAKETITLWAQMKLGPRKQEGDTAVILGKMMKGNVDLMEARWEIKPVDAEHTLVGFQFIVVPSLPLPSGFITDENLKAVRRTLKALRGVVAQTPTVVTPAPT